MKCLTGKQNGRQCQTREKKQRPLSPAPTLTADHEAPDDWTMDEVSVLAF